MRVSEYVLAFSFFVRCSWLGGVLRIYLYVWDVYSWILFFVDSCEYNELGEMLFCDGLCTVG